MTTAYRTPITHIEIETAPYFGGTTRTLATITRFGHSTRSYQVNERRIAQIRAAAHGEYTCHWPLGAGRKGEYWNFAS